MYEFLTKNELIYDRQLRAKYSTNHACTEMIKALF